MIKGVLFDKDGTLLDYHSHARSLGASVVGIADVER